LIAMKTRFSVFILIALSGLALLSSCGKKSENKPVTGSLTVTDDLNYQVSFDKPPQRIISLAPNLTEMIYSLGMGPQLAGNTLYCTYPPEARKVTKVGDMLTFDYEKILSLKPDLIFITVEGNSKDSFNKLKALGLKIFVSNPRDFKGIVKTYTDMGRIFGKQKAADSAASAWKASYDSIITASASRPHPECMFLVGINPVMVAGKNTFINELITSAGLKNIAADAPQNYPVYSREEIVKRNPDVIIMAGDTQQDEVKIKDSYPEWRALKALRNNRILIVDPDLYMRPGPRFIKALKELYSRVHHPED
ncbi:MAG: cobalamin-binding protein, partial [Bacteroidota bacterium]